MSDLEAARQRISELEELAQDSAGADGFLERTKRSPAACASCVQSMCSLT